MPNLNKDKWVQKAETFFTFGIKSKVVDEWLSKGGKDVIKEATEKYKSKTGVTMPRR